MIDVFSLKVGLGIILKNENAIDEMIDVLQDLSQYIPQRKDPHVHQDDESLPNHNSHNILLGGDQLTEVRARSAIRMRQNSETGSGKLQGFIPVIEDWHSKVILLGVCCF